MGCACSSSSIIVRIEAHQDICVEENNSDLSIAPVLQRPRNIQWCWTLSTHEEQWQNYTDIENEIIEDAFNENKNNNKVEINKNFIIDFQRFIQYRTNAFYRDISIKRLQLDQNHKSVHFREKRFGNAVVLANSFFIQQEPWPKRFWRLAIENKNKTMGDLTEDAATGIIKVGTSLGKAHEAQWLAKQLLAVKHHGNNVKAEYYRVPKQIGETCVYLYTKESFWYKSIYNFYCDYEFMTDEKLKTYAPFCHIMHLFLKKDFTSDSAISTVYRSLNLNDEQRMQFKKDNIKLVASTSSSKSREYAECFGNTLLIIQLDGNTQPHRIEEDIRCGSDISILSHYPHEQEFLIWPRTNFSFVKEDYDEIKHRHIIYLQCLQIMGATF